MQYWSEIGPGHMSEESTVEDDNDVYIRKHTPHWRSSGNIIHILIPSCFSGLHNITSAEKCISSVCVHVAFCRLDNQPRAYTISITVPLIFSRSE